MEKINFEQMDIQTIVNYSNIISGITGIIAIVISLLTLKKVSDITINLNQNHVVESKQKIDGSNHKISGGDFTDYSKN